jgi:hypothetical protein
VEGNWKKVVGKRLRNEEFSFEHIKSEDPLDMQIEM